MSDEINTAPMTGVLNIVIAHYLPNIVSGAENSIADFADQVSPRFKITMLVPGEGSLANFYRQRGFNVWVREVQTPRRLFPGLHEFQSAVLAQELKHRQVDVVLCNTFPAASRVATACRLAKIPYAIYMRDYVPDSPLHRRILQQADVLLAISQDVINQHAGMARPDQFRLAYNFINPQSVLDRFAAHQASGRRLMPFAPDHPVVGLVGRLTPYKQPDLFIRAVPRILDQLPDTRFVIVGSAQQREKPYEHQLHTLAAELGLHEELAFLGQRRDALELTSELTVACLASGREPLGRVVLEAHLLGVPVVVPDTGGPAEIVLSEETGLHFVSRAADAADQLASQVVRLLQDPELRVCLSEKGRERVFNTFANQRRVEIQEAYIEQLAHRA